MKIKFQTERFRLALLSSLVCTSMLFGMQISFNDFLHENKNLVICAGVLTAIAIPSYLYYKQVTTDIVCKYKSMVAGSIGNYWTFAQHIDSVNFAQKFKNQDGYPDKKAFDAVLPQVQQFVTSCTPPDNLLREVLQEQNSLTTKERKAFDDSARYYNDFKRAENQSFYLKTGNVFTRILGARRMQKIIDQEKYATIGVPKKYLLLSTTNKKNWFVAANKISNDFTPEHNINLDQMKELVDFVDKTGFCDFQCANWRLDDAGNIIFIDTEHRSFSLGERKREHNVKKLAEFFEGIQQKMSPEADKYLKDKITDLEKTNTNRNNYSIPYRKDLDDNPHLDNIAIYQFLRVYNKSQQNEESSSWDKHETEWILS